MCVQEVSVADLLEFSCDSTKWERLFFRVAQDLEVDAFIEFFNLMYSTRLCIGGADKTLSAPSRKRKVYCSILLQGPNISRW